MTTAPVTFDADAVPRVGDGVRVRRFRGKLVAAVAGEAFELTDVAMLLFRGADGTATVGELAALVAAEYDVDIDEAVADAAELFTDLAAHGVVEAAG